MCKIIKCLWEKKKIALVFVAWVMLSYNMASGAELTVVGHRTLDDRLILYLRGMSAPVASVTAQIGTQACEEVEVTRLSELPGTRMHTMILIDNSFSISPQNREVIRNLLEQLIRTRLSGEVFSIYSFDTELRTLVKEEEEEERLLHVLDNLEYKNQNSYLKSSLQTVLVQAEAQEEGFARVLLVSDGADDEAFGPAEAELLTFLQEEELPLYVLASRWEQDLSGLEFLYALTRAGGGKAWLADDADSLQEVPDVLHRDGQILQLSVSVPPEERDGSRKNLSGTISTADETYPFSKEIRMPVISSEELNAWRSAQTEPVPETEPVAESVPLVETETEITVLPQEPSAFPEGEAKGRSIEVLGLSVPLFLIPVLVGIFVSGIGFAGYLFFGRRVHQTEEENEEEEDPALADLGEYAHVYEDPKTELIHEEDGEGSEHTQLLWKQENNRLIRLVDLDDPGRSYPFPIMQEMLIGRSVAACEVSFPEDRAISAKHCRIRKEGEKLLLEDLHSSNGTFLNHVRVTEPVEIQDGDMLKIGEKELQILIEAG